MKDAVDSMLSRLWPDDYEKRRKAERDADHLQEILAESTASEVGVLRLALARIVVDTEEAKTYDSGCHCAGKGCSGHVTETTKTARAALGLPELPDPPRVEEDREAADA